MKELTQATMPEFIDNLRALLTDRRFTYYDERGFTHPDMQLQATPELRTTPEGFLHIDLKMGTNPKSGGIGTGFVTYKLREDEALLADAEDTCRMWYEFTDNSLEVRTRFTHHSAWKGVISKRFTVNS